MALPIIRCLGQQNINSYGFFGKDKEFNFYTSIIQHSKFLKEKFFFDDSDYSSGLINALVDFGKGQKEKSVIFLASDQDMIITSRHRDILKDYFLFTFPPHELLDTLLNKEKFINLAYDNNLPIPKSKKILSGKNIKEATKDFDFPFIIKPSWRDDNWLTKFHEQKILHINSKRDIEQQISIIETVDTKFLIQEIIPGSEKNIICSFAILDDNSQPIEIGHCRKIHQYPAYFGNTSLAEPIIDDEVEELSLKIFKILQLKGYASIEYKKDQRDGKLKILEITPGRFNRQFAVTNLVGLNLPYALYNYLLGREHKSSKIVYSKARWVSEINELRTIKTYIKSKEHSLIDWIKELWRINWFEIFDRRDIRPFFILLIKLIKLPFIQFWYKLKIRRMINKIYYFSSPLISRRLQIFLRRKLILCKRLVCENIWPIDKRAAKLPGNWSGWPGNKQFALILTHDVDTANGHKKCHALIKLEQKLGFMSSFNFVPKRYDVSPELRSYLSNNGFEVGVHGLYHDGKYFNSRKIFQERTIKINQYLKDWNVVGFRSPSMLRNLKWFHDLNIEYDASTFDTDPFEPQSDGVCTIFPFLIPNNSSNGKGYVELPYTLPQDFTLFVLMQEKGIEIWKKKLDWIAEKGGMALLITHPDYMNFEGTNLGNEEYPVEYYIEFLEYIKTKYKDKYWHTVPKEIARFWSASYANKLVENRIISKRKIWIDLDNSPHVPFFKPIIEKLTETGYSILLTARDCSQTCRLADLAGLHYKKIGRHHGKNKFIKLCGLFYRAFQLISTVVKDKPSLALSHGSRAQLITAKFLGIPSIVILDYEYTQSLPLIYPDWAIVPEVITHSEIKNNKCHILKYPGIKEDVYVPNFKPNPNIKEQFGLHENDLIITIRPPATDAHYFVPQSEELFEAVMDFLIHEQNVRLVLLPRNEKQSELIRKTYQEWIVNEKIVIPNDVIDGLNLIWFSDFVISGGGTMNREAAALGVPVYSIFRGKIGDVDRYLSESGRLILIECIDDIKTKIPLKKRHISQYFYKGNENTLNSIVGYIKKIEDEACGKSRN